MKEGLCVGEVHRTTDILILPITEDKIFVNTHSELEALQLRTGEIGEICVAGNHVLSDYLDNEEAVLQNKIKVDGSCWHRTGDSGFLGTDGLLYLTGRASNLFTIDGKVYSPFILEYQLKQIGEIDIATIMKMNNLIVLFVSFRSNVSDPEFLNQRFPFVDEIVIGELPKDPRHFSKIDYGKLREMYLKRKNIS